jgi:hypothetical protein
MSIFYVAKDFNKFQICCFKNCGVDIHGNHLIVDDAMNELHLGWCNDHKEEIERLEKIRKNSAQVDISCVLVVPAGTEHNAGMTCGLKAKEN